MLELAWSIVKIVARFYLFFAYAFFLIPYLGYIIGKHTFQERTMQTIAFLGAPLFVPLAGVLMIGWCIVSILGGVLVVVLFALVSWLAWLYKRFPFGKVFKAWFTAAYWVLEKIRELLEMLGIKKLFFGVPLARFVPLQQA